MQTSITFHFSNRIAGWIKIWLTEAISAVNVMMKVLVPTAVFSSIPRKAVNTISIIIPPPVPTNPVPKPIVKPKNKEIRMSFQSSFAPFSLWFSLEVSGLIRKRIPMKKVRKSVKFPSTTFPTIYAA